MIKDRLYKDAKEAIREMFTALPVNVAPPRCTIVVGGSVAIWPLSSGGSHCTEEMTVWQEQVMGKQEE